MELAERARPGVEEHAGQAADAACRLADVASGGGWSAAAADDALTAIDTLADAVGEIRPEIAEVLAAVKAATSTARRGLGLPVEPDPAPAGTEWVLAGVEEGEDPAGVPGPGKVEDQGGCPPRRRRGGGRCSAQRRGPRLGRSW
ncbi:hypothetical protein OG462_04900 [Streptomyces sp. NBC_01077]|uniref:hypothetical protein n=1 Tax=Streptomyces sp. NBC_01077 TaxID=2903746 RepID=UPI003868639B|nr:hypothetical protein OG462_04900 [Streptomyces sp. NBC_01077]